MNEDTAIVRVDESVRLGSMVLASSSAVVERATIIAKELANIINTRKLYTVISRRKFVQVEGWTTLGAMLGVMPREDSVLHVRDDDFDYFDATVSLIRTSDGAVVGRASAICGTDEKTWANRPAYARRSMAVTRATGKAFRLGFSWIMTLAGYEPTPAEEMPTIDGEIVDNGHDDVPGSVEVKEQPKPQTNGKKKPQVSPMIQALLGAGAAPDVPNAAGMLNKAPKGLSQDEMVEWGLRYRGYRDEGKTSDEAAELATA
jgi:hypothetical protein